jgi:CRISPR system Cascade subunit CasC
VSQFLQIHALTTYPPSNPNRDDLGRPKTAMYGGAARMRISSQALKRAIRTSDAFQTALQGHLGSRTQRIGEEILAHLQNQGVDEATARTHARAVADVFGKLEEEKRDKKEDDEEYARRQLRTRQLAFVSPDERRFAFELAEKLAAGEPMPKEKDLKSTVLRKADGAVDIALFGRMLADDADFNREAAVQIAHAITTHKVHIEDDYYTAVDDLKKPSEDMGAGFIGELGFSSGVFYLYACVDLNLLRNNLQGDLDLTREGAAALVEGMLTAAPPGKQYSFAHKGRASFALLEKGAQQPRTLAAAFLKPVWGDDYLTASVTALTDLRTKMDQAYGPCSDASAEMNVAKGTGTLDALKTFAREAAA